MPFAIRLLIFVLILLPALPTQADDVKQTEVYARLKAKLDAVHGIDTHSHLRGPSVRGVMLKNEFRIEKPTNSGLYWVWRRSYYPWAHPLAPWPKDANFAAWWTNAQSDFQDTRAVSAYRCMLPIFTDLYGVDFEKLTPEQAEKLDEQIEKTYEDPNWGDKVLRQKAKTDLLVIDSFWRPMDVRDHYPFTVSTLNVGQFLWGFDSAELKKRPVHDVYAFAAKQKLPLDTLDDYIDVIDRIMAKAKSEGVVCLKSANAYERTLKYDWTPKQKAEEAFGHSRKELTPAQIKNFQDYVLWEIARLAAKHDLPFQIHTGHARIQGSNPMNLVDLIEANRKTKFILFHGGFPWVSESGMIALRCPNVWLDSVWMPVLSHTIGKRAYKEWLDMFSSDRIMWGSDMATVDGTYGTTMFTRQCITEALAEKVVDHELSEANAERIGRQILRENALKMFPTLRERLETEETAAK